MAGRVGIIRDGRLAAVEDVSALRSRAQRRVDFHFRAAAPSLRWTEIPGVVDAQVVDETARFTVEGSLDPLLKSLDAYEVVDIVSHETDLEDAFLSYYSGDDDA